MEASTRVGPRSTAVYVRKLTSLRVIDEIPRLRKNRYGHIDTSFFGGLKGQEVLDDLTAFRALIVEKLWMKLDAVEAASLLLHCLNLARLV